MATPSRFGFSGLAGFNQLQKNYNQGFRPGTGGEDEFGNRLEDPFRAGVASGRSYMDPNRAQERIDRWKDRSIRQNMAGGQQRMPSYGGGGGGGGPQGLLARLNENPLQKPIKNWQDLIKRQKQPLGASIADMAQLNRASRPNGIDGSAEALARIQAGVGDVGDYAMNARQENPNSLPETQAALGRIRFGQQRGIRGAMSQALFGYG